MKRPRKITSCDITKEQFLELLAKAIKTKKQSQKLSEGTSDKTVKIEESKDVMV